MRRHVLAAALVAIAGCDDGAGPVTKPAYPRSMIILGIDGMDPQITRTLLARGEMPNLQALIDRGGYSELDTTIPPQSPVAWSTFITGADPGVHGIYDFVHRDPEEMAPYLATSKVTPPEHQLEVGSFAFPLGSPDVELLRRGTAFWQILEDKGVPATVVKVPANFPPPGTHRAESMSGMGTPDLMGTYGTYQLVTDDPQVAAHPAASGIVHRVAFHGQHAHTALTGPASPLSATGEAMTLDVDIVRDPDDNVARIRIGDSDVVLAAGEWSDWLQVSFDPGLVAGDAVGAVRLYLRQTRPTLHLYVTPIQIDPLDAAMPVSSPARYAADLAHDIGRYYTQGMPEPTKALSSHVLSPPEFLEVVDQVMTETEETLDRELARFHGGLLFVYLSSIDQTSHVFFRSLDPEAPPEDREYADVIPGLYRRVDRWIGHLLASAPPNAQILVMSDHGFAPYKTKVNLNTFLAQRGYLAVLPPGRHGHGPLGHVDWRRTQAYALGLQEVFVNLRGREAHGAVEPADRDAVVARLERDLLALRDPETGVTAITRVDRPPVGPFTDRAPDLIVGYRRGYRSSDESGLGGVAEHVFEANHDQWSGDHCMDATAVPGVLFASTRLAGDGRPALRDLAPTILDYFGITPPADMHGHSVLAKEPR